LTTKLEKLYEHFPSVFGATKGFLVTWLYTKQLYLWLHSKATIIYSLNLQLQ